MRPRSILLLIIALVALAFGVWQFVPDDSAGDPGVELAERLRAGAAPLPTKPGGGAGQAPLKVQVYRVEPQRLEEEVVTTGALKANEEVELRAQASGRVVRIAFEEGAPVRQGALLLKIDDAELQAQLKRAEVERNLAETQSARAQRLFAQDTISREEMEEAAADLDVRQAEIALLQARIDQTEVRAPFDGIVGLRSVSVGTYLTPAVPIATLQNLNPMKIDFAAPEKYAGRIALGDAVEVMVAGTTGPVTGHIYAIEPRVDAETRTLQVRARTPNPGGRLLPGAFARVRVVLASSDDALLVPSIALVPGQLETRVFVVEDGIARPRTVVVGARTATQVEIAEGLRPGEVVITSGIGQIKPGDAVEVLGS
jgi:membrane fusion protein, multidrug efflux system